MPHDDGEKKDHVSGQETATTTTITQHTARTDTVDRCNYRNQPANQGAQHCIQNQSQPKGNIPHAQSDKKVSPESTKPNEIDMSPCPFSLFSSSSRSLKLRGTMTTSPAGVFFMMIYGGGDGIYLPLLVSIIPFYSS
jgi:hypothetical protein